MSEHVSNFLSLSKTTLCLAFCTVSLAASQTPERIHHSIDDSQRFTLRGSVKPAILSANDHGQVSASLALPTMTIHFTRSAAQQADLLQLLRLQQTRHSGQYHQWLTPEQFAERFGINGKDLQKVQMWLEAQGFTNVKAALSRSYITFGGTAVQVQSAFHTAIHSYVVDGVVHYANATDPELPSALNGIVESIRGLHDFRLKPHARPRLTSSVSGNHFLVPDDWATIYDVKALYNSGYDGTGHSIAVVGQTDLVMADIETFQTNVGQPVKDPQVIVTGVDPGLQVFSGDLGEADLDVEWAGAVAKGAKIIFVTSLDVTDAITYAVDNNVADVLSITYGECEAGYTQTTMNSLNSLFQQAATQGMTVVAASGDSGAGDCDSGLARATSGLAVDVPAASPWVTGVGGTEFNEGTGTYWNTTNNSNNGSVISYIPEFGWNDTAADGTLSASGGGASVLNTKPTWQLGIGVPADGARDVPDVAFDGSPDHDGYITCSETAASATATPQPTCVVGLRATANGNFNVIGGTSAAAPAFAAIAAILDQKVGVRQGLLNPNLYSLASISSTAFRDITTGNNVVPCRIGTTSCTTGTFGYSAGTGYDQVTGLGSVDAFNMVLDWTGDFSIKSSVSTLSVPRGTSQAATITVAPVSFGAGSFTGNVTFTCVISGITNASCSAPGTVNNGSGSVTLTITAGATASTPWGRGIPSPPNGNREMILLLAGLMLALSAWLVTKQQKMRLVSAAFTFVVAVGLTGCGGGSSTTSVTTTTVTTTSPAETGSVVITGTSGALANSTSITLTVL